MPRLQLDGQKSGINHIHQKRWTVHGTHTGDWMGIPATGKEIVMTGNNVFRIANGKIAECWAESDALGLMQQLGVIPPLG